MNPTPILFGFLIGAILGVLITDINRSALDRDAEVAFKWDRIKRLWKDRERNWISQIVWAATRLRRLEWITVFVFIWLVMLAVWIVSANSEIAWRFHILWLGERWWRNVFVGSVVGAAAAPWVWLHFSSKLSSIASSPQIEVSEPEDFSRYRFLTYAIGAALLFAIAGPYIATYFLSANKVEAFGVSISHSEQTSASGSVVLGINLPPNSANTASGRLTADTLSAAGIANPPIGEKLSSIDFSSVDDFDNQSTWDRDQGYIAYLIHAANRKELGADSTRVPRYRTLGDYILAAEKLELSSSDRPSFEAYLKNVKRDMEFMKQSASRFSCLNTYAEELGDVHLYFLDTSPFLKYLAMELKQAEQGLRISPPTTEESVTLKKNWDHIDELLKKVGKEESPCAHLQELSVYPTGVTPYPALLLLFSMAAVDSPDTGILYLSNWQAHQRQHENPGLRSQWYSLRAKINLAQMAAQEFRSFIEPARLIEFQRRLTDQFATLLGVESAEQWADLCRQLARNDDLHARIGRRLALTYALERSYLFELEEPGIVQTWQQAHLSQFTGHLREDLEEATAFVKHADCFSRVPIFEQERRHWMGQLGLNVVQLRIDLLLPVSPGRWGDELPQARRELNAAVDQLGHAKSDMPHQTLADDLLAPADSFDDQRQRAERLKLLLVKSQMAP